MNALLNRMLAPAERFGDDATLPTVVSDNAITIWEYKHGARVNIPQTLIPTRGFVIELSPRHYGALQYVAELERQRGRAVDTVSVMHGWLERFSGGERCEYDPARRSLDEADLKKLAMQAPRLKAEIEKDLAAIVAISLTANQIACLSDRASAVHSDMVEFIEGAVFQKTVSDLFRLMDRAN